MATVKLMKTDSTLVKGVLTTETGTFAITAPADGRYILTISSVGYKPHTANITVAGGKNVSLGSIRLSPNSVMLKETTVTGTAAKMVIKEDTFIYNASAYRTPEGSVLEELVKKLPGAKIDDDGKITINGKEVKKILVDGEEFMNGDTKTAMKNLPTSIIEKVKSYDEKSDFAKSTGIDDGEESTVLDFGIKRGMKKGVYTNNDVAIGTDSRYSGRVMGGSFVDNLQAMLMGNANNVNDRGFSSRGGRGGGGRNGLSASKMAGLNINYKKKGVYKLGGNIRWNHNDGDAWVKTSSENFMSEKGSFSNRINQNYSRSNSWSGNMRFEWTPDTLTTILARVNGSYNTSDGVSMGRSATFSADPYLYVSDPLSEDAFSLMNSEGLMVNSRSNNGISYSDNSRFGGTLQLTRRLMKPGRAIVAAVSGSYSDAASKNFSTNSVHLYQKMNAAGQDSTYQTNRFNLTPRNNYSIDARLTYNEPLGGGLMLQFNYEYQHNYTKSDRSTYDFSSRRFWSPADNAVVGAPSFSGLTPNYREWDSYLDRLDRPWEEYISDSLSRFSEYRTDKHTTSIMLRYVRPTLNMHVGIRLMPEKTHFVQSYYGHDADTVRSVINIAPSVDARWKISKLSQLRFNYNGNSSQPDITSLLDIKDDSDPLNVSEGNPGLKPAFTHSFRLFYNNYIQHYSRSLSAFVNFRSTQNSISNRVVYDSETGGRTTRPENINGDWNVNGSFLFNTAIDSTAHFNVNTTTGINHSNNVGYLSLRNTDSQKNTRRTTNITEELAASYRNTWGEWDWEMELSGSMLYSCSRNKLQPNSNLDTWRFSYGGNTTLMAPWGMQISTDMYMNSRRGYSDATLNTNELIWNAQISQSFLRQRALTVSLQFYDILNRQSSFSRSINAMQRTDTEYNAITSYAMLHVIFKTNMFGGKGARQEMRHGNNDNDQAPTRGGGGGRGRGGRGGGGRGGFGGGFGGGGMF